MECIFITGASGTGKTTYAKMIAQNYGYNTYISSGGKNPLDNYKGEECVILDDTRSSTWSLTDFLKLTDNHTDSLVGCRYYNKSIAECKLLIVTSCKSLAQFYENATKEDDEPRKQLYRRFGLYIKMFDDDMNIATYNNERDGFVHSLTTANPVSLMRQNTERSRQRVQSFIECMGIKEAPKEYTEHDVNDELPF